MTSKAVMRRLTIDVSRLAHSLSEHAERVRIDAAAITLTEMYFRPLPARLVEFVYASLLYLFGRDYLSVSVGISQISLRHITERNGLRGFRLLYHTLNSVRCLDECCFFIANLKAARLVDISHQYNGRSTVFYLALFRKNRADVSAVFARLGANHPSSAPK